jgi:hypothetical protein
LTTFILHFVLILVLWLTTLTIRSNQIKKFYLKSVHFITVQHKLSRAFQTKYFKGELMCFRRGSVSSLYSWDLQIVYSLTDGDLFHVNAFTCISHVIKMKIKIISGRGLLKSLWLLSFFIILYWYWFVVTLTIRFLNITCFWKFFFC